MGCGIENFDIRNPAWDEFVQRIAIEDIKDLGIKVDAGVVKEEIYRVRVWAVGACLPPSKEYVNWPYLGCFHRLDKQCFQCGRPL